MKSWYLFGICFTLAVLATAGCSKKSPPSEEQSEPQVNASEQPSSGQTTSNKSTTQELETVGSELREQELVSVEVESGQTQPGEIEFFAILMEGQKVGHAVQNRVVNGSKVTTTTELEITLSRTGIPVGIQTKAMTVETIDGRPLGFELEQVFGFIVTKAVGTVSENGRVQITAGQQRTEFDWPAGAVMAEGMRLLHFQNGLKEGTKYDAKLFDPSVMQVVDVEVEVGPKQNVDLLGRVVPLTLVQSTVRSPQFGLLSVDEYYDDNLRLQKSIMPLLGMIIEQVACTKEFALGQNDVLEVVDKMFMPSPVPLEDVDLAKSITYYLSRVKETSDFVMPSNDNQKARRLSNGMVILKVEPAVAPKGIKFPYKGSDPVALEALEPTRYVESDQEIIIDLARRAVGDTGDTAEAARRIEAFVSGYITNKSLSIGYASAAEVAVSRQGDCSEHAVLVAAMCRAVGIPAQVVTGLAYVPQWRTLQNGFGGHAWAQAYIGGKWIGLDAAFKSAGLGGFDPGHITLAEGNGNPEDFLNLINTLGLFKIDEVIVQR
jgi:hypothetical protein